MVHLILALCVLMVTTSAISGEFVDQKTDAGSFRIHFPDTNQDSCVAILHGVGTGMATKGYDSISGELIARGYIVVVMDPQNGSIFKNDVEKMRQGILEAQRSLSEWTSACGQISKWVVGGHSAGGGAVHSVVAADPSIADAIFSVDAYEITPSKGTIALPSLHWGFDLTTCFVSQGKAAQAAFEQTTSEKRVLIRVDSVYAWGPCGYSPKFFHCSIADGHCPVCTNCKFTPSYFFVDVANSVDAFVRSALASTWDPSRAVVSTKTPTKAFVGETPVSAFKSLQVELEDSETAIAQPFSPAAGVAIGATIALALVGVASIILNKKRTSQTKTAAAAAAQGGMMAVSSSNPLAHNL